MIETLIRGYLEIACLVSQKESLVRATLYKTIPEKDTTPSLVCDVPSRSAPLLPPSTRWTPMSDILNMCTNS